MNVSLYDLDFGKDTAEFDKDLARYFVATSTYNRVLSGKKSIVAGRKGAGKTALMNYFVADAAENQAVITLEASHDLLAFRGPRVPGKPPLGLGLRSTAS